jgi:hypothetical protein
VKNNTGTGVERAAIQFEGPNPAVADNSPQTFFNLGIGKEGAATVAYPAFKGVSGAYTLMLRGGSTTAVHQPGFAIRVARSCRLDLALER